MKRDRGKIRRAVTLLGALNRALAGANCEQDLFDEICALMTSAGAYRMAWLGLAENDADKSVRPVAEAGFSAGYLQNVRITWDEHNPLGRGPAGCAIRTGKAQVVRDIRRAPDYQPWFEAAQARGYAAVAALPIKDQSRTLGVLCLYAAKARAFDKIEIHFLLEITHNLAYALDKFSERRAAETALRRSRESYRRLVEDMPQMLCRYAPDTTLLFVNRAYCESFGKTAAQLEGSRFLQLIPPAEWLNLQKYLNNFTPAQAVQSSEHPVYTADGQICWQRWIDRAFFDDEGRVREFQSVGEDITAYKEAETALEESREQFRLAFDNANIGIVLMSMEGRLLKVNPEFARLLGYSVAYLEGRNILDFTVREDYECSEKVLFQFKQGMNQYYFEKRYLHADGHAVWVQVASSHARDTKGRAPYLVSHVLDISARKHSEAQLQRLATIVEQATVTIVLTDSDGRIIYANPYFETITGYRVSEAIGQNPRLLQSGYQDKTFYQALWHELTAGKTWSGRFINRRKDGSFYHEAATLFPIKDKDGVIINYAAVKRDISEQVAAEEALKAEREQLAQRVAESTAELRHSNAELARAVRLKDEFLANMSHELRTPLNAILTLSEVLEETLAAQLSDKQQQYFHILRDSGEHLLSLINDILDVSKIEAGRMELEIQEVDIQSLCEASLSLVKQLAAKKKQVLNLLHEEEAGTSLQADVRRLKQMLVNLLSNAIKFTPEGGHIYLHVRTDKNRDEMVLSVCDTGIGIAEEDIARLFQPFTQLDGGLSRQYTGTGLGLALVSRMAALHGGRIDVNSTLGQGSCFNLRLPWQQVVVQSPPRADKPAAESANSLMAAKTGHILLVDDAENVLNLFYDYMTNKGFFVRCARNGQEALDAALSQTPDVVLMDINMPDMDGLETTRRFRVHPQLRQLPIIALTALAMDGDRERCLAAGMQDYLSKPVQLKALLDMIRRYLPQK
jgi:PAS domain S-box-containing protein